MSNPISFIARLLVIVGLILAGSVAASAACPAEPFVRSAGNAFLGAARSRSPSALAGVASRYTDLRGIALFALGPHRNQVAKGEEARYVSLTRGYIGRFLAKYSGRISGSGFKVISCTGSPSAPIVNAQLGNGSRIIFKLSKTGGGYTVRDVNFSSVWLAQQLRSTFVGVVNRNGGNINALYNYLGS